jgi:hypothetical protein
VARGTVNAGNTTAVYAVIQRGVLPPSFAVRFSFAVSSLEDLYIVHQSLDQAGAVNMALSLQSGGWTFGPPGQRYIVAAPGSAGAWHTFSYRFESAPDGGGVAEATFDTTTTPQLDLSAATGSYKLFQIGPFWPLASAPAPLVVDYDNVTVWDCSK